MRIAFDYQAFGLQEFGGVSRYFYQLSMGCALDPANQVEIVAPLHINRYLREAPRSLKVIGSAVPNLPKTGRLYRAINAALSRPALSRFRPDIVHETYYSASRIAPRGASVILTVFDMIHEKFSGDFSQADVTSRNKANSVARADHIICISEQTRRDVVELLNIQADRTSVIHLGFALTPEDSLTPAPQAPQRPTLLYVGRRDPYKNFGALLSVYASSPKLRTSVDLVCFGGGAFTSAEQATLRELKVAPQSVYHRSGNDTVLADLYRSARALVYPSLYEGFGIPPLEAMSFNCPVVCSNASSLPEVVGDAAEMFDPYNHDSMRTAIERVVDDESLRRTLILRGHERLHAFSWQECTQKTLAVYRQVLA